MELKKFIDRLLSEAISKEFDDCEVYYVDRESLNINVYKGEVEKYSLNNTFGISFRGLYNNKIGYSYTEILDDKSIDMLINSAKDSAMAVENEDMQFIYEGDKKYTKVDTYYPDLENINPDKLIDILLKLEEKCKEKSENIYNFGGCAIGYSNSRYGLVNSKGLNLSNKSNLLSAYVVPILKIEDEVQDGMGYVIATNLEEVDIEKISNEAIEDAMAKIGGKSIKSNKYKVVIKNEAMSSMIGTFSSVFSGDSAQKGLSLLKDKEGQVIGSKVLTLVDDPLLSRGLATTGFDDEGVATYRKEIISSGKLITLMHNLKTAYKARIKTTGNGFKSSYSSPVGVSPTNLYIEKGNKSFNEIVKTVNDGIIITEFAGMHSGANSVTGDFSLAAKGFRIENGIKTYPIDQITVAGNFFQILKDIEEIGNDLIFPMSSIGSPSVIIKELSVAGE